LLRAVLPPILSKAEFRRGFVPPDYLVDGILQRGFIYSLTGQTGAGKTAVALRMAELVTAYGPIVRMFGGHEVERGRCVYFVGENPDDVRMRIIGSDSKRTGATDQDNIEFIPGVFDIDGLFSRREEAVAARGPVDLVIVDTSAAYFPGEDENNNVEIGKHPCKLRRLTTLPGKPTVLVVCLPVKHVTEAWQLMPRGRSSLSRRRLGCRALSVYIRHDRGG
jgi:RecA-family ATPase